MQKQPAADPAESVVGSQAPNSINEAKRLKSQ